MLANKVVYYYINVYVTPGLLLFYSRLASYKTMTHNKTVVS